MVGLTVFATLILWLCLRLEPVKALQISLVPSGERVRFELIGDEPIAGPDGRSIVRGWSVLMFRDRTANRCYLAFKLETDIAVEPTDCPQ